MPVLHDHADVSYWTLEALEWIKEIPRKSIDVSQVSADLARLAERSPALNDHLAGLLKFTMMPSDEELEVLAGIKKTRRKELYRKCAARRLEFERTMWLRPGPRAKTRPEITPERVEHLAACCARRTATSRNRFGRTRRGRRSTSTCGRRRSSARAARRPRAQGAEPARQAREDAEAGGSEGGEGRRERAPPAPRRRSSRSSQRADQGAQAEAREGARGQAGGVSRRGARKA